MAEKGGTESKNKKEKIGYLISIIIIVILLLLFFGIQIYSYNQTMSTGLGKMKNVDPNLGTLFLYYENSTKSYNGYIGPIMQNYGNKNYVEGAEIKLSIKENKFIGKTNVLGYAKLNIPQDIIESLNLDLKYEIKITKEGYYDLSWKVKIEIKND